ncbi:GMC oxidoreductase [Streptomyces ochraceiscleroticus]|uniref:Cholesterol oxidase n=1 Tax=Streptomyces ochraceiscleroticus TaxID=47761 RepID=A0ABW1MN69_9ACTN|nr:GMC oxidoreductase [Streptomyces ochraceiscleroticus]
MVVGSGFGGSVAAFRLAQANQQVVVLERGRAYRPGAFPRAPHELTRALWNPSDGLLGLFDVWSFRGLAGVVASGLGGGSLIYANVLLPMDEKWFVTEDPGTGRNQPWPVTRADLDPHYKEVQQMLGAQRFPFEHPEYAGSGKTAAMWEAAERLGLEYQRPPLAVSFSASGHTAPGLVLPEPHYGNIHGLQRTTCRLCGECDIGCQSGSKNTLDHTYLSAAQHYGADIRPQCEVRSFEPTPSGWSVRYVEHRRAHDTGPFDTKSLPLMTLTCNRLVLAAGTFGTTYLLLRNRAALPGLSPLLGHRFCGNGDLLGFVFGARDQQGRPRHLGSSAAPVITSAIRVPDRLDGGNGRGYYVEDAGYPAFGDWLVESFDALGLADRVLDTARAWARARLTSDPKTQIAERVSKFLGSGRSSAGATALLGIGRDVPDGVMRLRGHWLDVDWRIRTSRTYFDRVGATMERLAKEFGGSFRPNPLSWLDRVVTVHPLGGAPMGHSPADGVIDSRGEVFGYPGLFVVDGAAMPGPVGTNPALTIAAFADWAATAILEGRTKELPPRTGRGAATAHHYRDADTDGEAPAGKGVTLGEDLKGHFAFDATDPEQGAAQGRADGTTFAVHLRVELDDVDGMVADPQHACRASGRVHCDALGGRLPVAGGTVNLLVNLDQNGALGVRYRLFFTDAVGYPLTLVAWREIRRGPLLGLWHDATTRPFRILAGHVEAKHPTRDVRDATHPQTRTVGAGVASIHGLDLIHSLTSLRGAARDPLGQARTLVRFGTFVLDGLWRVYAPAPLTRPGTRTGDRS